NHGNWSTSAKSYEQFIKNFWNWNTITSHHGVRGQSAFDLAEQIEEGIWMIPTSSQSHDLRQQPLADPAPPGRDGAQARPHARRGPSTRPPPSAIWCAGQSSKEGLKKGISCRVRRRAGWARLQRSKSLSQIDKSPDRANATKEAFGSTRCSRAERPESTSIRSANLPRSSTGWGFFRWRCCKANVN